MTKAADTLGTNRFSEAEKETLLCLVGYIIPPSAEFNVPGADDPQIFADILRSTGRDGPALRTALQAVNTAAGGQLSELPDADRRKAIDHFRRDNPDLAAICETVTARCYYRDDRVMASIGIEVRPPFPLGYEVEKGDLSLLEPVRKRGIVYRDPA